MAGPVVLRLGHAMATYPVVISVGQGEEPPAETQLALPEETQLALPVSEEFPAQIRIGPERHNYVYDLRFTSGVYQCCRCSDWGNDGDRLFLFKNSPEVDSGPGP